MIPDTNFNTFHIVTSSSLVLPTGDVDGPKKTPRSSGMLAGASDALRPLVRLDYITTRWRGFVPTEQLAS
jgi:hypothetical protein